MNETPTVGVTETLSISQPNSNPSRFIVRTESKFSNIYIVDAPDAKAAVEYVLDTQNTPDFIQRHLGERAIEVKPTDVHRAFDLMEDYPHYA